MPRCPDRLFGDLYRSWETAARCGAHASGAVSLTAGVSSRFAFLRVANRLPAGPGAGMVALDADALRELRNDVDEALRFLEGEPDADGPLLRYERRGGVVRLTARRLSTHELREVLTGLWRRLDAADRVDHIRALLHYQNDPTSRLSPVAGALAFGDGDDKAIDVDRLIREEFGVGVRGQGHADE